MKTSLPLCLLFFLSSTTAWSFVAGEQGPTDGLGALCYTVEKRSEASPFYCSAILNRANRLVTAANCRPHGGLVTVHCHGEIRTLSGFLVHPKAAKSLSDDDSPDVEIRDGVLNVAVAEVKPPFSADAPTMDFARSRAELDRLVKDPAACRVTGFAADNLKWGQRLNLFHRGFGKNGVRSTSWTPAPKKEDLPAILAHSGPRHFATDGDSGGVVACPNGDGFTAVAVHSTVTEGRGPGESHSSWTTNYAAWLDSALKGSIPAYPIVRTEIDPAGGSEGNTCE